jgi:hypothetical protein
MAVETDGSVRGVIEPGESSFPYLAGFRGDTVMVFSPQLREFVEYVDGKRVDFQNLAGEMPERGALQFAALSGDSIYVKVIAEKFNGYILRMDRSGMETHRWDLTGPYWRYAGLLRMWGDSLMSLSGYRPVVHIAESDAPLDTLHLQGFDSPMLARSRSFVLGEEREPPLLTASAAALGSRLFVLNMRPGWLNVDVYDHEGQLRHILTQPSPEFNQQYFPTDIAVKRREDGGYDLAVAVVKPEPRIERYIWRPRDREDVAE